MNEVLKKELLNLVDKAIFEADLVIQDAKKRKVLWLQDDAGMVKANFEKIKQQLVSDDLQRSEGAGLGITRALSEMGAPERLYKAGKELECFYIKNWNSGNDDPSK